MDEGCLFTIEGVQSKKIEDTNTVSIYCRLESEEGKSSLFAQTLHKTVYEKLKTEFPKNLEIFKIQ